MQLESCTEAAGIAQQAAGVALTWMALTVGLWWLESYRTGLLGLLGLIFARAGAAAVADEVVLLLQ
jgi:hypothetical protein